MTERCGVVALVGAPNAGKSTLMNQAIGSKVSIVTHKVQTTRTRVRGVAIRGDSQIVFTDTPGIFTNPKRRLERAMVGAAWQAVDDADLTIFMFDAQRKGIDEETRAMVQRLSEGKCRLVLALNKVDAIKRERLLDLALQFSGLANFEQTFMISALNGDGVDDLLDWTAKQMNEGPWLYPDDQLSDLPMRLIAAEITREKLFLQLHEELPYSLTVETDSWKAFDDGEVRIDQTIYVQREQHKRMAIGHKGSTIRRIREQAQNELQGLLDTRVHLYLFVKVRERWVDDPARYKEWGLEFNS